MNYELFQQGPAVYVPLLLISLVVTAFAYGAIPFVVSKKAKKPISKKKYILICYGLNFLVMILFIAINGESSGGPYFLWTWIFAKRGINTLAGRGILKGANSHHVDTDTSKETPRKPPQETVYVNNAIKSKKTNHIDGLYKVLSWILVVLMIATLIVALFQVYQLKQENTSQLAQINTLQDRIFELEETVNNHRNTINSQTKTISTLKPKANMFDDICDSLSHGNIGAASNQFKVDNSLVIVRRNERDRKITLTTNWSGEGTVSASYSSDAAMVEFDSDSWTSSVKLTIIPRRVGATVVTFSSDGKTEPFKMLIIVVD